MLGRPVTVVEAGEMHRVKTGNQVNVWLLALITSSLLLEDLLYTDKPVHKFTCKKQDGYNSVSECFELNHGSEQYKMGFTGCILPKHTAKFINYSQLIEVLTSTDEKLF